MFQTQGAAAEEDVTEEDGSEERSAKESGKEEIYVRDKKKLHHSRNLSFP